MSDILRPCVYLLISRADADDMKRSLPAVFPTGGQPGAWLSPSDLSRHLTSPARLITADSLWDCWTHWDTELYEIETRPESASVEDAAEWSAMRLVRRVEGWNPTSLWHFACDQVEDRLYYVTTYLPEETRAAEAVRVARRFADGDAATEDLDAAREAARVLFFEVPELLVSVMQASEEERRAARARCATRAAMLIATPDQQGEAVGTRARMAVEEAFQAHCLNAAGWIAANVVGRQREAALCRHVGVGSPEEIKAIGNGRTLDGGWRRVRHAQSLDMNEVVDLTSPEE